MTWHEQMGLSPDEIVSQHPTITLANTYAALAYYHDNFDRIRQDLAASAETAEKRGIRQHPAALARRHLASLVAGLLQPAHVPALLK